VSYLRGGCGGAPTADCWGGLESWRQDGGHPLTHRPGGHDPWAPTRGHCAQVGLHGHPGLGGGAVPQPSAAAVWSGTPSARRAPSAASGSTHEVTQEPVTMTTLRLQVQEPVTMTTLIHTNTHYSTLP